jgi:alanine dehydrogenase
MAEYGVPKEVRDLEMRVGLAPSGVLALVQAGHTVYVEHEAGLGAGFTDENYRQAGGQIVYSMGEVYGRARIITKVTRPTAAEHQWFQPGQTICSFLHLQVASPDLRQALTAREMTAVAYEMIEENGERPVLLPASEIAGRMAPLIAGQLLRSDAGTPERSGRGILLSGIPGVPSAVVVILGAGVLGSNAARAFLGLGAEVTVLDQDMRKLRWLDEWSNGRINSLFANEYNLRRAVEYADVLVGAILVPGSRSPVVISREMVRQMRPGSVIIDFSIDEGGCVATSRPTTLRDPIYVAEGVIHSCIPNITAAVARTTSYALTNAALPYLLALGQSNTLEAIKQQPALARGLILYRGRPFQQG